MMGRKWFREVDDLEDPVFLDDDDEDDGNRGDVHVDTDAAREMRASYYHQGQQENKKICQRLIKFLSCVSDANEKTKAHKKFLEHSGDKDEVEATTGEEATTSHPTPTSPGICIEDYIIGDDDDDVMRQFLEGGGGGPKINWRTLIALTLSFILCYAFIFMLILWYSFVLSLL
ncbi:hypothetical protein LIER_19110 [Lithospermum erythrorhizon]|uniref:Uncharacterized protein n=1 Tax=Lithospermum erythrorhizon TaxID=34254 RepID=A0AAV3QHH7_LITER